MKFSKSTLNRWLIWIFATGSILFPWLAIISRANYIGLPLNQELASVFVSTFLQAVVSATVSLIAGVFGGFGILWMITRLPERLATVVDAVALVPNAAPVLIMLLAVAKFFPWAHGLTGIVVVHALINTGLVAVAFAQLARSKLMGNSDLAYVEGASQWLFFRRCAWPILKSDLSLVYLFIFAMCFTSFAVPLAIGGSRATTLEVLIYQKIRISGDWSQALGLALLQMGFIFLMSWILGQGQSHQFSPRLRVSPLLQRCEGVAVLFIPLLILIGGLLSGLVAGYQQVLSVADLRRELPLLFAGSALVGFSTGLLMIVCLLAIAFAPSEGWFRRFLIGYGAPSSVLTGFGLLIAWREFGLASYFKISVGLVLIWLPAFYRYRWDASLQALRGQISVARTLGASAGMVFHRVIFPQIARPAFFIGGLAALWAWGEFALTSVVAERTITLAQASRGLMDSYRFEGATALVWLLLMGGLVSFSIFLGAGYVLGAKSQT